MFDARWAVLGTFLSFAASAQGLQIIPVPAVALDASAPHAAYNGHATTFKAIARGGNGTYLVEWDFQGDGSFDASAVKTNRYNLSTTFTYPSQATDTDFVAVVRVTSNGQTVQAAYPVHVYADVPADPAAASPRQLQIMRNVALDDGLWFLHTELVRTGNEADPLTGAQVTATFPANGYQNINAGLALEALGRNGHYPAFPAAYAGTLPDAAENARRWSTDPYAEDSARLVNYVLTQVHTVAVAAADESNLTGFYPEVTATPIPGTDDGLGLYVGYNTSDETSGPLAAVMRGFAVSHLAGFVAQVGDANRVLGRRFDFIVQQFVDAMVWGQNDVSYTGSWYYTPNGFNDLLGEFEAGTLGAMQALATVEQWMRADGVIVPNLVKARLLAYIVQDANTCPQGGSGYSYSASANGVCDFALSAAGVFALGWVRANTFSIGDTRVAFPSYNALSRTQLRALYDASLVFIGAVFNGTSTGQNNWDTGFVEAGDWGRLDGKGNHWALMEWARAARIVEPELVVFGTNDYTTLFSRYLINNQAPGGGWNWTFSPAVVSNTDNFLGQHFRSGAALAVLSPDDAQPVALARASATTVVEGTPVTFTGSAGVSGPVTYAWSLGNGDVRTGASFVYAFPDNGLFDVTLTVTTAGGSTASHRVQVTVTNAAPVVDAGVDLVVDEGTALPLSASVFDPGVADTFTYGWTFGDGQDAGSRQVTHAWADNGTFTVTFTATDDDGASASDALTVTVRNVAPTITSTPGAIAVQGSPFQYTLTFTDPGTADTHTCSAPTMPAGAVLTGCALTWTPSRAQVSAPQAFTLCVTDKDAGQACQSFEVIATALPPSDAQPVALARASSTTVVEGAPVTFTGFSGVTGFVTYAWDLGNGEVRTGESFVYAYPDNGVFTVTLTVSTVTGATATHQVQMTVSNAAPVVDAGVDLVVDEGAPALLSAFAVDPGAADTLTYGWSFGDGQAANTRQALHTWADNGTFTATFTATDDDGAATADSVTVTVRNVAPTITSTPSVAALQASPYRYTLSFTDPGTADTHTCSAPTMPVGGVLTGCAIAWTPTRAQCLTPQAFTLCVTDDDSGQACQSFEVIASALPLNQPPTAPRLDAPSVGSQVAVLQPTLTVGNATDSDGDALTYEFEVSLASTVVASVQGVAEGTGTTSWQVSPALLENHEYTWRARAVAAQGPGPWSGLGRFLVNTANSAPPEPVLVSPQNGTVVDSATPTLVFLAGVDADGDALVFDWQVAPDESFGSLTASGAHASSLQVTLQTALSEDARYCWRVRADDGQAQSAWVHACFRVSAVDDPPTVPSPVSPGAGAVVALTSPLFSWTGGADPEGAAVTFDMEVSEDSTVVAALEGVNGSAAALPTPLVDGKTYRWRVRAVAGGARGAWSEPTTFQVQLPQAPLKTPAPTGCGCTSGGGALVGPWLLLLSVLARRRRVARQAPIAR